MLRYDNQMNPRLLTVDGLRNFWHVTATPGATRAQLVSGVSKIARRESSTSARVPAILLSSSPYKAGTSVTPWHDSIDSDTGYALYYGDSKVDHNQAPETDGNMEMRAAFRRHCSPDRSQRLRAEPLILFERVSVGHRRKGFVRFAGFGIIEQVSLITQVDNKTRRPFANYAFELLLLDLATEGEDFSWDWISSRRSEDLSDEDCLKLAPESWRHWVKEGEKSYPKIRRSVAKSMVVPLERQRPFPGTAEAAVLKEIVKFYEGRKARFEAVAELVAESVLSAGNLSYHLGWISPRGHDFGIDFVARLDIGDGFARTPLIVLGQAKCEGGTTSAKGIARMLGRLQRGWFGCYVTTSVFSTSLQEQLIEDRYPIARIHGLRVSQEVQRMAIERGLTTRQFLEEVDQTYGSRVAIRRPEEVLSF